MDEKGKDDVAVDECTQAGGAYNGATNAHEAASSRSGNSVMSEVTVAADEGKCKLAPTALVPFPWAQAV